jgi:CRISPR-associated exonuclease Cas4
MTLLSVPSTHDEDFQPIRALNDLLFCPRRCALHRIEQVWVENAHTLEGTHRHRRAHADGDEDDGDGVRCVRGLWLRSSRLRLVGKADVVELHARDDGSIPYPVEYKRGRKRRWDNDDVQLCAQAFVPGGDVRRRGARGSDLPCEDSAAA